MLTANIFYIYSYISISTPLFNKDFINNSKVQQLHKPVVNLKSHNKFIVSLKPNDMIQIDLLDYQKFSRQNKGYKFILIGVDVFTRKAYGSYIEKKTPASVLEGFKKWDIKPNNVYHDLGNEFRGAFNTYAKENDIENLTNELDNHKSLGVIDRFSKTLKSMLSKYMTQNNTTKIYDVLNKFIDSYNKTPHSSLGNISPDDVIKNEKNFITVLNINQAEILYNKGIHKSDIKIGDFVRIKRKKINLKKATLLHIQNEFIKLKKLKEIMHY